MKHILEKGGGAGRLVKSAIANKGFKKSVHEAQLAIARLGKKCAYPPVLLHQLDGCEQPLTTNRRPNTLYPNTLFPNTLYPNTLYPNTLYPNTL